MNIYLPKPAHICPHGQKLGLGIWYRVVPPEVDNLLSILSFGLLNHRLPRPCLISFERVWNCKQHGLLNVGRLGKESVVLEASENLRVTGFAFTTWTNAWKALDALGIGEPLRRQHQLLQGFIITTSYKTSL